MHDPEKLNHRFLEASRGDGCARLEDGKTCGAPKSAHKSAVQMSHPPKRPKVTPDCAMCSAPSLSGSKTCANPECAAKFKEWRGRITRGGMGVSMARSGVAPGVSTSRFTRMKRTER